MPHPEDEEELDDLPPLDGDAGDGPDPEPGLDDMGQDDGENATLDDATGENDALDPNELELDEEEDGWLGEAADNPDLNLGDMPLLELGEDLPRAEDSDGPVATDEDCGLWDTTERSGLDSGDEGPLDEDEELREEDLPDLDADDEGELEDAGFVDARFAADEPLGLPWAAAPWSRVGAPVALVTATAVACAWRGALVAGRADGGEVELIQVDLEGCSQALATGRLGGASVRALSVEADAVAVVSDRGGVLVSHDGGMHFGDLMTGSPVADVAFASGVLWMRTHTGDLLAASVGTASPERWEGSRGRVSALTRDGVGSMAALVVDDARRPGALLRGSSFGTLRREPIAARSWMRGAALLAVRGDNVAFSVSGGVMRRKPDGSWHRFAWGGHVTGLVFVGDAGTLLAATYSDSDDTTSLVCVDASGHASVVARTGSTRADDNVDGRAVALACDDARGVVWVAGGFGVAAFATRQ